jgi:calcium-dependent protein kinase
VAEIYDIKEMIGEGNYGKVYRAVHKETGINRALKVILKKKVGDHMKFINDEIDNLKKVDHPNIVKLLEHYTAPNKIILVQELLYGEQLY